MSEEQLIRNLLRSNLPFVLYSYPGEPHYKLLLQFDQDVSEKSDSVFHISPFSQKSEVEAVHIKSDFLGDIPDLDASLIMEHSPLDKKAVDGRSAEKAEYRKAISVIKNEIDNSDLKKLVLSRQEEFKLETDSWTVFSKAVAEYEGAFVYLLGLPDGTQWVGATPEILISRFGQAYYSMSLAGTKKTGENWTSKEEHEQRLVTEFIETQINAIGADQIELSDPYETNTGVVQHLCTDIRFRFKGDEDLVVNALHPTPAVCGTPTEQAFNLIERLEPHDRKYYTGYIGMSGTERSRFFVNLRCAEFANGKVRFFAGGGITAESDAESEWQETQNKLNTLKRFL